MQAPLVCLGREYPASNFYDIFEFSLIFSLCCKGQKPRCLLWFLPLSCYLPLLLASTSKRFNDFSSPLAAAQIHLPFPRPWPEPSSAQLPNKASLLNYSNCHTVAKKVYSLSLSFPCSEAFHGYPSLQNNPEFLVWHQGPYISWLFKWYLTLGCNLLRYPLKASLFCASFSPCTFTKELLLTVFQLTALTSLALPGGLLPPPKLWWVPLLDT